MEQLVFFGLFILFSVVSALRERRKRQQAVEESRRRYRAGQPPVPAKEEEEEKTGDWNWPEIFEPQPPSRPRRMVWEEPAKVPGPRAAAEAAGAEATPGEGKYRRAEEELQQMEQRVQEMNQRTREADRRSQQEFSLMEAQAASRMSTSTGRGRPARGAEDGVRARRQGWALTPQQARRAVVYAEIFGPPKSLRQD